MELSEANYWAAKIKKAKIEYKDRPTPELLNKISFYEDNLAEANAEEKDEED